MEGATRCCYYFTLAPSATRDYLGTPDPFDGPLDPKGSDSVVWANQFPSQPQEENRVKGKE